MKCTTVKGWRKLTPHNWSWLLARQPDVAEHCDEATWGEMNAEDWSRLLCEQPSFAVVCVKHKGFSSLTPENLGEVCGRVWSEILQKESSLEQHCPVEVWEAFAGGTGSICCRSSHALRGCVLNTMVGTSSMAKSGLSCNSHSHTC